MAILWLSGRTALLLTLFGVLAAIAMIKRKATWLFVCTLLALGSKEEAVALPFIFAVWAIDPWRYGPGRASWRRGLDGLRVTWPSWLALAAYFLARSQSGAFNAETAPSYYRFTSDIAAVLKNVAEYADRSMTFSALALVLFGLTLRVAPRPTAVHREAIFKGVTWLAAGFALTMWLPVRSSLYAVFPGVGVALAAGALAESMTVRGEPKRSRHAVIAASLLPLLLLPIYWSRSVRGVELADLSSATIAALWHESGSIPPGTVIELRDDRAVRANLGTAFGTLYPEASRLLFGDRYQLWIEPPSFEQVEAGLHHPSIATGARFLLEEGRLRRSE